MSDVLSAFLLVIGAAFMLIAAVGIVRMPDLFMRLQAASKAVTLGAGCMLFAVAVTFGTLGVILRALATIAFFFLTVPVATHVIARASYFVGIPMWQGTRLDELRDCYDQATHELASSPRPSPCTSPAPSLPVLNKTAGES